MTVSKRLAFIMKAVAIANARLLLRNRAGETERQVFANKIESLGDALQQYAYAMASGTNDEDAHVAARTLHQFYNEQVINRDDTNLFELALST